MRRWNRAKSQNGIEYKPAKGIVSIFPTKVLALWVAVDIIWASQAKDEYVINICLSLVWSKSEGQEEGKAQGICRHNSQRKDRLPQQNPY